MGAQGSLLCEQMLEDVGFENVQAEDETMQVTCSQVYLYKRKDIVESKIWVFMKGNIQMIFGSAVYMNMLMPSSSLNPLCCSCHHCHIGISFLLTSLSVLAF
jgi:hypothetical protein